MNHSPRFLVADDSASTRRTICRVLSDLGFAQVDEASDGVRALECLHAHPYDVVLTDWYMPYMSGLELLRRIRSTPDLAHTPVLMVTGFVTRAHMREACDAGANGFVMKPFIADSLGQKLSLLLGASGGAEAVHA